MDLAYVFECIGKVFMMICEKEFVFAGYSVTVGAVFIWSALAGLVIWFLKGIVD